ncbi:hypothetical protein BLAT2472_140004 [Burkholderia latens]
MPPAVRGRVPHLAPINTKRLLGRLEEADSWFASRVEVMAPREMVHRNMLG